MPAALAMSTSRLEVLVAASLLLDALLFGATGADIVAVAEKAMRRLVENFILVVQVVVVGIGLGLERLN